MGSLETVLLACGGAVIVLHVQLPHQVSRHIVEAYTLCRTTLVAQFEFRVIVLVPVFTAWFGRVVLKVLSGGKRMEAFPLLLVSGVVR